MKTCRVCKTEKQTSEFSKDKRRPDGLQSVCKECQKVSAKAFREKNPNYFSEHGRKAYITKYRHNNKERYQKYWQQYQARRSADLQTVHGRVYSAFSAARLRSQKSGVPFDITFDWLLDEYQKNEGRCAVTGLQLTTAINKPGESRFLPFNPSLDQIIAGEGYTTDNTRIVAVMVNLALNSFGDAAFDAMCESYIAKKSQKQKELS